MYADRDYTSATYAMIFSKLTYKPVNVPHLAATRTRNQAHRTLAIPEIGDS